MVFSSTIFLCVYLPLVLLGYYICPKKGRNLFLLIVSLVFYAWGEPKYVFLMIFSILVNYIFGRLMDKNRGRQKRMKLLLVLSVVIDLGLLSVFKYTDFIITNVNAIFGSSFDLLNIALPIGISFYTFQAMSYTIDIYRNDVRVQKNLIDFGMYITMFPQLIAGPIVRYADVQDQLAERSVTTADFSEGVMRFVVGLGKKVLLANQMGAVWSEIYALGGDVSALMAWTGAIAYTFQIYFDFSGYSDMAIGLGRLQVPRKLPLSVSVRVHNRLLAQVAYHAEHVVQGISLYSTRRQPLRPCPSGTEPADRLVAHRLLARSGLELRHVGPVLLRDPVYRKAVSAQSIG
mgnify:CR=1 FL=1